LKKPNAIKKANTVANFVTVCYSNICYNK